MILEHVFNIIQQCKKNGFHVFPRCDNSFKENSIGFYKNVYAIKCGLPIFNFVQNRFLDSDMKRWKKNKFYAMNK